MKKINLKISFGESPEKDWRLILSVATLGVLAILALSVYFFLRIDKSDVLVVDEAAVEESMIDLKELGRTVRHYQDKEANFEALLRSGGVSPSVDPSL